MAQPGHHAPNLSVPAFGQHDVQAGAITIPVKNVDLVRQSLLGANATAGSTIRQHHALPQPVQRLVREFPADRDLVFLLDAVTRMCQSGRQITVIGQDKQPG